MDPIRGFNGVVARANASFISLALARSASLSLGS